MEKRILVSLVSDQTIPNITFIKMSEAYDEYWFITTSSMEGEERGGNRNPQKSKSNWIIDTCQIREKSYKIEVIEDDLIDIKNKISSKIGNSTNYSFVLNMTCGTKMMSLGAYLYFKDMTKYIYYTPIGKKFFKNLQSIEKKNTISLTIKDYLNGYGISFTNKRCLKDADFVEKFFNYFFSDTYDRTVINSLRIHYRGKKCIEINAVENFIEETYSDKGKRIENLSNFLSHINFSLIDKKYLSKNEIEFLTGGWFEEFVYHRVINQLQLVEEDEILLGVNLTKNDIVNQNDLDVVVVKDNKFIVIECKTGMKIDGKVTQLFNETVYKAAALKKLFGLFVESYLFTLEDLSSNNYIEKANILGIKAVDLNQIKNNDSLTEIISKF